MLPLLVIDDAVPSPTVGYGYPRAWRNLSLMREVGFAPVLVPVRDPQGVMGDPRPLADAGIEVVRPSGVGAQAVREVVELARGHRVCWISRLRNYRLLADALRQACPDLLLVYDAEALVSLRDLQAAALRRQPAPPTLDAELATLRTADLCVAVCDYEAHLLRRHGVEVAAVVGHVHEEPASAPGFAARRGLLHVGGFLEAACPNRDALGHFMQAILPAVAAAIPDIHLDVVGYRSETVDDLRQRFAPGEAVRIHGAQADLGPWYDRARVVVVPTRLAAGIAYKATEAMARGVPMVCTSVIGTALGAPPGAVHVASSPRAFAEAVVALYTDEATWQHTRRQALEVARTRYSAQAGRAQMARVHQAVQARLAAREQRAC